MDLSICGCQARALVGFRGLPKCDKKPLQVYADDLGSHPGDVLRKKMYMWRTKYSIKKNQTSNSGEAIPLCVHTCKDCATLVRQHHQTTGWCLGTTWEAFGGITGILEAWRYGLSGKKEAAHSAGRKVPRGGTSSRALARKTYSIELRVKSLKFTELSQGTKLSQILRQPVSDPRGPTIAGWPCKERDKNIT